MNQIRYFETFQEFGKRVAAFYQVDGDKMMEYLESHGWKYVEDIPEDSRDQVEFGMLPPGLTQGETYLMTLPEAYLLQMERDGKDLPFGVKRRD